MAGTESRRRKSSRGSGGRGSRGEGGRDGNGGLGGDDSGTKPRPKPGGRTRTGKRRSEASASDDGPNRKSPRLTSTGGAAKTPSPPAKKTSTPTKRGTKASKEAATKGSATRSGKRRSGASSDDGPSRKSPRASGGAFKTPSPRAKKTPTSSAKPGAKASQQEAEDATATPSESPAWLARLEELEAHKAKTGDCHVSIRTSLGAWVSSQRKYYQRLRRGEKSPMTPEKVRKLENVGFLWEPRVELDDANWEMKFEMLEEFRSQTGHCVVPKVYPENSALASWVGKQRAAYRKLKQGKRSKISEEQIERLTDLGFVFDASKFRSSRMHSIRDHQMGKPRHSDQHWQTRYEELQQFKKKTGHTLVPKVYPPNSSLSSWVGKQRKAYKLYKEGEPSKLTSDRVEKLKEIGFIFDASKFRSSKARRA